MVRTIRSFFVYRPFKRFFLSNPLDFILDLLLPQINQHCIHKSINKGWWCVWWGFHSMNASQFFKNGVFFFSFLFTPTRGWDPAYPHSHNGLRQEKETSGEVRQPTSNKRWHAKDRSLRSVGEVTRLTSGVEPDTCNSHYKFQQPNVSFKPFNSLNSMGVMIDPKLTRSFLDLRPIQML